MCDRIQPRQEIRFTPTTLAKWFSRLALVLGVVCTGEGTVAQIVPDETLGNERSRLVPDAEVRGLPADLIEGGAERGANLFHSFEQFNVNEGQRVYFANPAGIENILGRVTGGDVSDILGTLGVDGVASLFLLNPNGIVFGENARLDVVGSFVASTADSFVFGDGLAFSATNPEAPPLLTINVTPGLQYGANRRGTIENAGTLEVGRDLTLSAGNLDLQGQLWAGGDLTLSATDTVKVRDSAEHPFIAAARGELLVQGNESVDIFALNHASSGLVSGGDMVLRSAEKVGGDAHYWSGGSFRIEKLDGSLGDLESPDDPVIRSLGDVSFNNYLGASLHIFAGGSVTIPGAVVITRADNFDFIAEDVTLSDGTTIVPINGSIRPTLDVRAGVALDEVGLPIGLTGLGLFFADLNDPIGSFEPPTIADAATSADIAINTILMTAPDGVVFLTNQYEPNTLLPGGAIEVEVILADDIFGGFTGKGGSVIIDSRGDISVTNGFITTFSSTGDAGNITLLANEAILLTNSLIRSDTFGSGKGGNAVLKASSVSLAEGAQVSTSTRGTGDGGELRVSAREIEVIGDDPINGTPSGLFARVRPEATGTGGNLTINTERLRVLAGAKVNTSTSGIGNAGDLRVVATDSIEVSGTNPEGNRSSIGAQVNSGAEGNGGNLTLETGRLLLSQGGQIVVSTFGTGDAGELQVSATEIEMIGDNSINGAPRLTGLFARVVSGAKGTGGNLIINTERLRVLAGATVDASTFGIGDAGDLRVVATDSIEVSGTDLEGNPGSIRTQVEPGAEGRGGNLTLETGQLLLSQGGQIAVFTSGTGDGGELRIGAQKIDLIGENPINGNPSGLGAGVEREAEGMGGNLTINTEHLRVLAGAIVDASTSAIGNAGDLRVVATDSIEVSGTDLEGNPSSISAGVGPGAEGRGGNLTLETRQLLLSQGGQIIVSTFGTGDAGELQVSAREMDLIGDNPINGNPSGLAAQVGFEATGRGGNLTLNTERLRVLEGATVSASTFGIGNAGDLTVVATDSIEVSGSDPEGNTSDISAGVGPGAEGKGGNLTLETGQLLLARGGQIAVSTFGRGDGGELFVSAREIDVIGGDPIDGTPSGLFARVNSEATGTGGNLILNTERLRVLEGATVSASTFGIGNAGDLTVVATDSIEVSGSDPEGNPSAISAATTSRAEGDGGDLTLETDTLLVQDGAQVAVNSPSGQAGNLTITADSLRLNRGILFAETGLSGSEEGANITLQDVDLLLLENESLISATALEDANGGNVTINADFIVAKSPTGSQGSDITANAVRGNGGRVSVTSNGLFGIEFRPQRTPLNDITVSSQFGLAGDFIENTSGIDPSEGLATLPSNLVDPESLIDRSCTPGSAALQSSFIITGRGGIPTSPTDPLSSNDIVSEWVTLDTEEETTEDTETPTHPTATTPDRIIEAQGWIVNERGQVVLVANAPTVSPQTPRQTAPSCEDIRANARE